MLRLRVSATASNPASVTATPKLELRYKLYEYKEEVHAPTDEFADLALSTPPSSDPPPPPNPTTTPPRSTSPITFDTVPSHTLAASAGPSTPKTTRTAPEPVSAGMASSATPARPDSATGLPTLTRTAEKTVDWFNGRVVGAELNQLLRSLSALETYNESLACIGAYEEELMRETKKVKAKVSKINLAKAFKKGVRSKSRSEPEVKGMEKKRKAIDDAFMGEKASGKAGPNEENEWMRDMGRLAASRSTSAPMSERRSWMYRKFSPLEKSDRADVERKPDTIFASSALLGETSANWGDAMIVVEHTTETVNFKPDGKLNPKNAQLVHDAVLALNVQPFRHFVLLVSFTKTKLFFMILDRERLQVATIDDWLGRGFRSACALVRTLETLDDVQLGLPPFLSYDATTTSTSPYELNLGALCGLTTSTLSASALPPPYPGGPPRIQLPLTLAVTTLSTCTHSIPFSRGTWVAGATVRPIEARGSEATSSGKPGGGLNDDGSLREGFALIAKYYNPDVNRKLREPDSLSLIAKRVKPEYLGVRFPHLVAAFHEDDQCRPPWKIPLEDADPDGPFTLRHSELIITVTPPDLVPLSELKTPKLFWTAIDSLLENLELLYDAGVGQRDLSINNALSTPEGVVCSLDFDHAAVLTKKEGGAHANDTERTGTPFTMASEVLEASAGSEKFYHRPRHDLTSVAYLVFFVFSTEILAHDWKELLATTYHKPAPGFPSSSQHGSDALKAQAKSRTNRPGWRSDRADQAMGVLKGFGWLESNSLMAAAARKQLWKGSGGVVPQIFYTGLQNQEAAAVLKKLSASKLLHHLDVSSLAEETENINSEDAFRRGVKEFRDIVREGAKKATLDWNGRQL
ncbi:Pkinase-fungal domain-containing protein [Pseudohyphozyma bogoriensis]|nr:Pkinase-fungal domain-containing protein [Pseudohyphozyma bogoriensis]